MGSRFDFLLPTPVVVLTTLDESGDVHQAPFSWVSPASKTGSIAVMMREGSRTLRLIEAGAKLVGVNRMGGSSCDEILQLKNPKSPFRFEPDERQPLILREAVVSALCEPDFAFKPAEEYTHYIVLMRVVEVVPEEPPDDLLLFYGYKSFALPEALEADGY